MGLLKKLFKRHEMIVHTYSFGEEPLLAFAHTVQGHRYTVVATRTDAVPTPRQREVHRQRDTICDMVCEPVSDTGIMSYVEHDWPGGTWATRVVLRGDIDDSGLRFARFVSWLARRCHYVPAAQ